MMYSGQIENGQMHGMGTCIYPNGEKYEAENKQINAEWELGSVGAWKETWTWKVHLFRWNNLRGE